MKMHPSSLSNPLSDRAIRALLDRAEGEWKGLVLLGLHTGQRLRDIVRLTWKCVDLQESTIRFHVAKTGLTHASPISSALREYLEPLSKRSGSARLIFPASAKATLAELNGQFAELVAAAGVPVSGFDALRVTFWERFQSQALPAEVMQLVRHQSSDGLYRYCRFDKRTLRKKLAKLPWFKRRKRPRRPGLG
jgi:integrase